MWTSRLSDGSTWAGSYERGLAHGLWAVTGEDGTVSEAEYELGREITADAR